MRMRIDVTWVIKLNIEVWLPNNFNTNNSTGIAGDIFQQICLFCYNASPFLQPLFINFYASFWFLSGFLLYRNNLNQFCLSARHPANETLQRQIPPPATQNHLKACITANLCQPLLGHGIWRNKLLIITCENAFLSAFLSVWGLTFRVAWREGVAIRINYSLLPLSK